MTRCSGGRIFRTRFQHLLQVLPSNLLTNTHGAAHCRILLLLQDPEEYRVLELYGLAGYKKRWGGHDCQMRLPVGMLTLNSWHRMTPSNTSRRNLRAGFAVILTLGLFAASPQTLAEPEKKPMQILDDQRYRENPIYLLFENYILDVIGQLPAEKLQAIQAMNLQKILNTKASEWHSALQEALGLSDTIDIAILDLWIGNQEIAAAQGAEYLPQQFAVNFTDEYMKDGSRVDVWPPGTLEAAKRRIAAYRQKLVH